MEQQIDTIVFDLGGVLIRWNPAYLYRNVFETKADMDHFLNEVCTYKWNIEQDRGRPIVEGNRRLIEQHPIFEKEIKMYYDRWEEMLDGSEEGSLRILKKLHQSKKYRLLGLTNFSGETFPRAQRIYKWLSYFEDILVSGYEKVIKPDPAIYKLLIKRFLINCPRTVFIDDNLSNVAAARAFGIHGIHFQSSEQLAEDLSRLGVKHHL